MVFLTRKIKKKRTVYVLLWLNCVCFNIIIYLALNLNFNLYEDGCKFATFC